MKAPFATLLMLAAAIQARAWQLPESNESTLTVYSISTTVGASLPGHLDVYAADGQRIRSLVIEGLATLRLPYGDYKLTLTRDWFEPVTRAVKLDGPQRFLVMAAAMEGIEAPNPPVSISVRVSPSQSCSEGGILWARVVEAHSGKTLEQRVNSYGYALFEPLEFGSYVIIVVDGARIRAVQHIPTPRLHTIAAIALAKCD